MERMINCNVVDLDQWKRNRELKRVIDKNAGSNDSTSQNPEQILWIFIMIFIISVIIAIINL